jgi:hypothetical protein
MADSHVRLIFEAENADAVLAKLKEFGNASKKNHEDMNIFKKGVEEVGKKMIEAFAVEKILEFGKEAIKAFAAAEEAARKLEFAVTKVNGGTKEQFQALTAQSEELAKSLNNLFTPTQIQSAQAQLANFGLTTNMIKKLTPAILDMSRATGISLTDATNKAILAINGQTKGLREQGITFKDTGSKTKNFNELLKDMSKFQGAAADSTKGLDGKLQSMSGTWEVFTEQAGKFIQSTGLIDWFDRLLVKLTGVLRTTDEIRDEVVNANMTREVKDDIDEIDGVTKKIAEQMKAAGKSTVQIQEEIKKVTQDEIEGIRKAEEETSANISDPKEKARILKAAEERINTLKDHYFPVVEKMKDDATAKDKVRHEKEVKEVREFTDHYWDAIISGMKDGRAKELKEEDRNFDKAIAQLGKEQEEIHKVNVSNLEKGLITKKQYEKAEMKMYQDFNKQMDYLTEEDRNKRAEINKKWDEKDIEAAKEARDKILDRQQQMDDADLALNEANAKDRFDRGITNEKQYDDEIYKLKITAYEDQIELFKQKGMTENDPEIIELRAKEIELYADYEKKKTDAAKEAAKERMEQAIEEVKAITDTIIKGLEAQSQAVQQANEYRLSQEDATIQEQKVLAERGLQNDLAFEVKRRSDLEKAQLQEVQKQKKLKELEIFLNSVENFTKDGNTSPLQAIGKALVVLAATKAAEATFAEEGALLGMPGNAKSMIGEFGASRRHASGKDILVHAEAGEGILSRREIAALGGPEGFYAMKNALHSHNVPDFTTPSVIINSNKDIVDELQSLKETILNKKEMQIDFEGYDTMKTRITENHINEIIRSKIKKPGRK